MQDSRRHSRQFYRALKTIFAAQLGEYGGSVAADAIVRPSRQTLEKYASLKHENADRFATLDVVADIDTALAEAGARPVVTEYLAQQCGFVLVKAPAAGAPIGEALSGVGKAARFIEKTAAALRDGKFDPGEVRAVRRHAVSASEQLLVIIAALDAATTMENDDACEP